MVKDEVLAGLVNPCDQTNLALVLHIFGEDPATQKNNPSWKGVELKKNPKGRGQEEKQQGTKLE